MDQTQVEAFAEMFVPAQYLPWVRAVLEVMAAISILLAALRPLFALVPAGPARAWIDAVDMFLHRAAGNTKALGERVAPEKKKS